MQCINNYFDGDRVSLITETYKKKHVPAVFKMYEIYSKC